MSGYNPASNVETLDYCFKHERGKVGFLSDKQLHCIECEAEAHKPNPDKCQEDAGFQKLEKPANLKSLAETCPNCGVCDNPHVCQNCGYCHTCKGYHYQLKAQLWPVTYIYYIPYQPVVYPQPPVWYSGSPVWINNAQGGNPATYFTFTVNNAY